MTRVLVTGAGRGIGRGIALALASTGHQVAIHYNRNRDAAIDTARECIKLNPGAYRAADPDQLVFQADVSVGEDRSRLCADVTSELGGIDALVNNAGMAPRLRADLLEASEQDFDEVLRVNLRGPYFLTQLVAQHWMADNRRPLRRIVFVTSVSAAMPSVGRGEYCVSKAGLSMAAALFAARLAGENVPVFEVRPGIIKTDMTAGVSDTYDRLIGDGLVPQGRWGEPSDVAGVVVSILAGHLDFCAGTVICPDGGLHIPRL